MTTTKEDADKVNETKVYTYDTLGRLIKTVTTDHKKDDKTKAVTYTYDNVGTGSKKITEQRQHRILIMDWIS